MKNTIVKLALVACLFSGLTACAGYYDGDGYSYYQTDSYYTPRSEVVWSDWHRHHHHHRLPSVVVSGGGGGHAHYGPPKHQGGGAHYGPPSDASGSGAHYGPPSGGAPSVSVG